MGKREGEQEDLFVTHQQLRSQSHPFYRAVNRILADEGFDRYVERLCSKFYAKKMGRPGVAPGVYFRTLLLGFFEGIDSERGIAWRAADSLSLRDFLGVPASKLTPDHSTISRTRRLIDLETHQAVFTWVLGVLDGAGLIKGKTIGVDATTLEANAAMRSIVRRDDGRTYQTFLEDLAKASGIETPTREDLARLDRKRKKKGSNDDWFNPNDPDAKITKMKDGRTHLAHKEEHAVDLDTGAVVAVTIVAASAGDTATIEGTLDAAVQNLDDAREVAGDESQREGQPKEAVADKGYHSKMVLLSLHQEGWRTYIAEPQRGRQKWPDQQAERGAVYANRRRKNGRRGVALMRLRGELIERPFAHAFETGGMRRTHLRHHENIAKRLLVHIAGLNLALLMRTRFGVGKPRCLQGRAAALEAAIAALIRLLSGLWHEMRLALRPATRLAFRRCSRLGLSGGETYTTGC